MKPLLYTALLTAPALGFASGAPTALEITQGIRHPESAIYSHQHRSFFVSNVASGNPLETAEVAYLSRISADGKTVDAEWVRGLRAPKGLALRGNALFVTDVDRIVRVDVRAGKIDRIFPVPGAKFLNDLVVDARGVVYASDMFSNTIYQVADGVPSKFVEDDRVQGANGLSIRDGFLVVSRWGSEMDPQTFVSKYPGNVVSINLADPSELIVSDAVTGHLDGLTYDGDGNQLVSDWMTGDVFRVNQAGEGQRLFNFGPGTADISYAPELETLLVPQMNQSKLILVKF